MTVVSQEHPPGLTPEVASALGIDVEPLTAPPIQLWPAEGRCTVCGQRVTLSRREFALLVALVAAAGHTVPRHRLYELVWGWQMRHRGRDVDVHVHKVRLKLHEVAPDWVFIHTHFGFGYRFAPERRS